MDYLNNLLQSRNSEGSSSFYSCCSANRDVILAALKRAKKTNSPLLVEATSNQVNQYGGYTGLNPADFITLVSSMAENEDLDKNKLIFGGDHLGPLVWASEEESSAMEKAENLVRAYVRAGYQKIHLDTSMRLLSDDPDKTLTVETCARRGAQLCKACEEEYRKLLEVNPNAKPLIYVIGSEVPVPGGEVGNNPSDRVTTIADCDKTIETYKNVFSSSGLLDAFNRIIALVVEMGVEFSEYTISEYNRESFKMMASHSCRLPMGYEAHSTDYQTREDLFAMCGDGAVFLKVGPALTFAARSALFKLELIEHELLPSSKWSHYREVLDRAMLNDPSKWASYYSGKEHEQAFARAFSFSDRCRYYSDDKNVKRAHDKLLRNLSNVEIPLCILAHYFPNQYRKIRENNLKNTCYELLYDCIGEVIDDYLYATQNNGVD